MTLRQEIEQAIDDFAREYKGLSPSSDAWEQYRAMTDRAVTKVCAAIGKTAKGMPSGLEPKATYSKQMKDAFKDGTRKMRKSCQDYWQEQVK